MSRNLLIVGAGIYGVVAKEIAESMGCFDRIAFVDDHARTAPNGDVVIGTVSSLGALSHSYDCAVVAIGNPIFRLQLFDLIRQGGAYEIVSLISPHAYLSGSARIGQGSIIEPMAVIHTGCVLGEGCIVSAGAVVNHASRCERGVHVDCNATVAGNMLVPAETKVQSGAVYTGERIDSYAPFEKT